MTKQEKLADFLGEFARWHASNYSFRHTVSAWEAYVSDPNEPPLKLKIGGAYQDVSLKTVRVVWKSPGPSDYPWLGVVVSCGETRWFNDEGRPSRRASEFKLIREVGDD